MNRRPGTDLFLADIFPKYEIILIGSGKQNSKSWDYNPLVEVDESSTFHFFFCSLIIYFFYIIVALVSISLPHELKPHLPFFMFNSLKVLNRPAERYFFLLIFDSFFVGQPLLT